MIFKHIFGVTYFKAYGSNQTRFINDIRKSNFICENIKINNDELYGKIYSNNYNNLKDIAKKNGMEVEIDKKKGLIFKIIPYRKRFGIIIGTIFSLLIILLLSNIVLKIKITGCDGELYNNVMSVLSSNGVNPGKVIPTLDFDEIERNIVLNVKNVSWASIGSSGGIIPVNLHNA